VPDEDDVIEVFVEDDLEDVGDVVVEVEVTAEQVRPVTEPGHVGADTLWPSARKRFSTRR
jgi:hypothetical protein